jgi:hypothetical protein
MICRRACTASSRSAWLALASTPDAAASYSAIASSLRPAPRSTLAAAMAARVAVRISAASVSPVCLPKRACTASNWAAASSERPMSRSAWPRATPARATQRRTGTSAEFAEARVQRVAGGQHVFGLLGVVGGAAHHLGHQLLDVACRCDG